MACVWRLEENYGSQFLSLHHPGLKKLTQFHSIFPTDPFHWLHKAKFKCSSLCLFSLLLFAYLSFPSFWLSHCKSSIFPKCSSNSLPDIFSGSFGKYNLHCLSATQSSHCYQSLCKYTQSLYSS